MTDIERIELAVRRTIMKKTSADPGVWFAQLAKELAQVSKDACTKSST